MTSRRERPTRISLGRGRQLRDYIDLELEIVEELRKDPDIKLGELSKKLRRRNLRFPARVLSALVRLRRSGRPFTYNLLLEQRVGRLTGGQLSTILGILARRRGRSARRGRRRDGDSAFERLAEELEDEKVLISLTARFRRLHIDYTANVRFRVTFYGQERGVSIGRDSNVLRRTGVNSVTVKGSVVQPTNGFTANRLRDRIINQARILIAREAGLLEAGLSDTFVEGTEIDVISADIDIKRLRATNMRVLRQRFVGRR